MGYQGLYQVDWVSYCLVSCCFRCFIFKCWVRETSNYFLVWEFFLGVSAVFKLILCSLFLGGILSFAFLISCGNFKERLSYFFNYVYEYSQSKVLRSYIKKGNQPENFHFTVPIFLSVMLYVGGVY